MGEVVGIKDDVPNPHAVIANLAGILDEVEGLVCVVEMKAGGYRLWKYNVSPHDQIALCKMGEHEAVLLMLGDDE